MRYVSTPSGESSPVDRNDLRACLTTFPVSVAVLFGSTATGTDTPLSDVDVAVVVDRSVDRHRTRLLDEIRASLMETTGRDAIDLVDLDAVGPALGYEILSSGDLLLGNEDEVVELESRFLVRKLDFQPITERWQRSLDRRIETGDYGRP